MTTSSSVIFLICWHGRLPLVFPLFPHHSCRYNPDIDFLIFTDNSDENLNVPTNVKIIPYSLEKFKAEAAFLETSVRYDR